VLIDQMSFRTKYLTGALRVLPILLPLTLLWGILRGLWVISRDSKYQALSLWVMSILAGGTIFYRRVEGWSWLDALYFCVITLTTIGYGDLHPTQPLSKMFTIGYIFLGLGTLASFINVLAEERKRRRMQQTEEKAGQQE
jgi:hypothetical protein